MTTKSDIGRVAWVFTYAIPLVLVALLCTAKGASSAPVDETTAPSASLEGELEDSFGGEECEMDEEGFVYCEGLEEEEEADEGPHPPEECLLRTARARAYTYSSGEKLRLVIRYTTATPADVSIEYRLKGGRGSLNLGKVNRHLGKKGLFQVTENLGEAGMKVAQAARNFFVEIDVRGAPSYCNRYYTRHLTVQKAGHNQVVWLQYGSVFGV